MERCAGRSRPARRSLCLAQPTLRAGEAAACVQADNAAPARSARARAAPDSDEIHIHIGRMEVIAAPPPRAARRAARLEGDRLEEYLSAVSERRR